MCFEYFNKAVKRMDVWDIGLTKLAVAAGVLFLLGIWPAAMNWARSVNPWYFLVAMVIFAIKPWSRILSK